MTVLAALGIVAAAVAALAVIWQKGLRPLGRFARQAVHAFDAIETVAPHLQSLPDALPILMEIAAEFRPNEGASLRDQMNRIEHHVESDSCRITRIEQLIEEIHT